MAGRKLFVNGTPNTLTATIAIRMGDNPANSAGKQTFTLNPGQQSWITYGNDSNIYMNGISVVTIANGAVIGEQEFVVQRGGNLDNMLNKSNVIQFNGSPEIHISSRQV
jgi:hypothetical protein